MKKRTRSNRQGAAMVELAFLLPITATFALGITELGYALQVQSLITSTARETVRSAVMEGATATEILSVTDSILETKNLDRNIVKVMLIIDGVPGDVTQARINSLQSGSEVGVRVSLLYSDVAVTAPDYLSNRTLASELYMRRQ